MQLPLDLQHLPPSSVRMKRQQATRFVYNLYRVVFLTFIKELVFIVNDFTPSALMRDLAKDVHKTV